MLERGGWRDLDPLPAARRLRWVGGSRPGAFGYKRTLSAAEQAVFDADQDVEEAEETARGIALRDFYFGLAGGSPEDEHCPSLEAETSETSELPPPADEAP